MTGAGTVLALQRSGNWPTVRRVCAELGVNVEDVAGRSRRMRIARARQLVWAVLRELRGYSLPELGAMFDRDHTTILYGIRAVADSADLRRAVAASQRVQGVA